MNKQPELLRSEVLTRQFGLNLALILMFTTIYSTYAQVSNANTSVKAPKDFIASFQEQTRLEVFYTSKEEKKEPRKHHLTGLFAFSFIPKAIENEQLNDILIVPTIGTNYDFLLNHSWSIGAHIDLVLQQYEVERHDGEIVLQRSFPISANLVIGHHFNERWMLLAGGGVEFEKIESFDMPTLGIDYTLDIHKRWDTNVNLIYDYRFDAYSSFLLDISFTYKSR